MNYNPNGSINLLIAKVFDDLLVVGVLPLIHQFHEAISRRFIVGRYVVNKDLVINRLLIHQQPCGSIHVNMQEYADKIIPIEMSKEKRRQNQDMCSAPELTAYQALAGSLNFLGHGILPQAAFAASYLQQSVGLLKVADLINRNTLLAETKTLSPVLLSRTPSSLVNLSYLALSDASKGSSSYGQTGYVSGLYLPAGVRGSTMPLTGSVASRSVLPSLP